MWIDRETVNEMRLDNAKAQVECRVLAEQNKVLQTICDWLRMRVNQLEKERSVLLFNATKLSFPVPEMVYEQKPTPNIPHSFDQDQAPSFSDPGDEIANHLGIEHTSDGLLRYTK